MRDWKTTIIVIRFAGRHHGIKIAMLSLLVVICCVSGMLIYWIPAYLQYSGLKKQIDEQRNLITRMEYNKKVSFIYAKSKNTLNSLNKKLHAKHTQSEHVNQLDKMLRKRQIKIMSETFDAEKLQNGFAQLTQELSLQGDYGELRRFMIDLDGLPTWTVVQDLRIEKINSYSSKIKAVLKMVTYYADG